MNKKIFAIFIVVLIIVLGSSLNFVSAKTEKNQNQKQEEGQKCGCNKDKQCECGEECKCEEKINTEEHRSIVANFVQDLLKIASRSEGGIGEQVRIIAQEQNDVDEKVIKAIEKVQKKNKIKRILIGSDYKNLGELRSEMVQTRNRIEKLTGLIEDMEDGVDKTKIQERIQQLEQDKIKIEEFVQAHEDKFSLFGWFTKLFSK